MIPGLLCVHNFPKHKLGLFSLFGDAFECLGMFSGTCVEDCWAGFCDMFETVVGGC